MQSKPALNGKKEKEKKRENGKSGKSRTGAAGRAVAAVGKLLGSARPGRSNSAREKEEENTSPQEPISPGSQSSLTAGTLKKASSGASLTSLVSSLGTSGSDFSLPPPPPFVPSKLAVVLNRQASGQTSGQGLSAAQPVEDFLAQGLLPVDQGLLQVSSHEPIGPVVEKIYQWRLRSCIVAFPDGKKEFFDCMDLACSILEAVGGAEGMPGDCDEDWDATKRKIRNVAEAPVGDAVRLPRDAGEFRRFDAEGSLLDLLLMFSSLKRVPVYRHGELCRVVTPSDILEMCCCVSEDTMDCLDKTALTEMMRVWPPMVSEIQVTEDFSVIEVLQAMRDSGITVAPVVESLTRSRSDISLDLKLGRDGPRAERGVGRSVQESVTLVGQFDTAALRVMLVHLDPDEGSWWWEDDALTRNILLEPCMDYLSLSGTVIASYNDSAPFNIMKAEESLARSIGRVLASNYQSVVVYPTTAPSGDGQASARNEPKVLNGTVSTLSLVVAMLQGGLFEFLRFDPSKPRLQGDDLIAREGAKRHRKRTTTLSKLTLPEELTKDENDSPRDKSVKVSQVTFNSTVDLEGLDVPSCPEHGILFLKFVQDGDSKYSMDFRGLVRTDSIRVAGVAAHCTSCSRPLGRVRLRQVGVGGGRTPTSTKSTSGFNLMDMAFSDNGWQLDLPFMNRTETGVLVRPGSGAPATSALKRGTNIPLKKSKTAERLDAIRANQQAKTSDNTSSKSRGFFGLSCCSPCQTVDNKDVIQPGAGAVSAFGNRFSQSGPGLDSGESSREDSGGSSPTWPATRNSSGKSTPKASGMESPTNADPTLAGACLAPGSRLIREGAIRARNLEIKDRPVKRSISDPTSDNKW